MNTILFLDTDGVILNYDRELFRWMSAFMDVSGLDWQNRKHYYLSDQWPDRFSKAAERKHVEDFGLSGGMARLAPCLSPVFHSQLVELCQQPNVFILSRFPEAFRADRAEGLRRHGINHPDRLLSAWGDVKKTDVMALVARRYGVPLRDCLLVDDIEANLPPCDYGTGEGDPTIAGVGLLPARSYNNGRGKDWLHTAVHHANEGEF